MLKPMDLKLFCTRTQSDNWRGFDIIIHPMNVRIGMVQYIVLYPPQHRAYSKDIERQSDDVIPFFLFCEGSVVGIMNYIQPDGDPSQPAQQEEKY